MRIRRVRKKLILDQQDYLKKIVTRFSLDDAKSAITPLPEHYEPEENKGTCTPEFRQQYQSVIGSLLYIMLGTRPDISYAVIKMAQFASNPSSDHMNKAKQIIRYLGSTTMPYSSITHRDLIYPSRSRTIKKEFRQSRRNFLFRGGNTRFCQSS